MKWEDHKRAVAELERERDEAREALKEAYSEELIAEALDEAVAECEREPATDLRRSFWDRLTCGESKP